MRAMRRLSVLSQLYPTLPGDLACASSSFARDSEKRQNWAQNGLGGAKDDGATDVTKVPLSKGRDSVVAKLSSSLLRLLLLNGYSSFTSSACSVSTVLEICPV